MADQVRLFNAKDITLREPSGDLAVVDTSPSVDTEGFATAVVQLNVTELVMADGDDEVDFYIQTQLPDGDWADVANAHFDNGDEPIAGATRLIGIGPKAAGVAVITPTDGTLSDDTNVDLPLGMAVRIRVVLTGATAPTYAYNASIALLG